MIKQYFMYILTNKHNKVLYTGVTSDLNKRIYQHKQKMAPGFTSRYNVDQLVYYEIFSDSYSAISREKQIKGGSRQKKIECIDGFNPAWEDLFNKL